MDNAYDNLNILGITDEPEPPGKNFVLFVLSLIISGVVLLYYFG